MVVNFPPSTPIAQVRAWLRSKADEGAECPVCTQRVQVYRRKINSGMARSLIQMYLAAGTDWQHIPTTIGSRSREEGKLAYWNLVEEERERRPDGGRAGYWRVTEVGRLFILGRTTVYKYARVFNGRCLGLVGDQVNIKDALGDKFDYSELMAGGRPAPSR